MAWNGAGTYVLNPLYAPEVNGTTIDAVRYNGLLTDVATGVTQALNKNGENSPTQNINWGAFKITNLGAGATAGDALIWGQGFAAGVITTTGIQSLTYLPFSSNGSTEAMRILVDQTVVIGATSSAGIGGGTDKLEVSGTIGFLSQLNGNSATFVDICNRGIGGIRFFTNLAGTLGFTLNAGGSIAIVGDFIYGDGTTNWRIGRSSSFNSGGTANAMGLRTEGTAFEFGFAGGSPQFTIKSNQDTIAQGVALTRVKAALTNRASSPAFADDPDLIVPLTVGKWAVEAWLNMPATGATANAAGMQVRCAFTGTQTNSGMFFSNLNSLAGPANCVTDLTAGTSAATKNTGTQDYVKVDGCIFVTVAGNLSIQWAQLVSQVATLTLAAGCYLKCTKLA